MRITFLGTSSGVPTRTRNVSAIGLQFAQQSRLWLFDCGEGTQHQFLRSPLRLSQLERIFITHLHGDHIFGLPGLIASRSLQHGATTPLTIYGPPGIADFLSAALGYSRTQPGYPVEVITVKDGLVYEDDTLQVFCSHLQHRVEDFGYAIQERPAPGRFNVEAALKLGIKPGPVFGRLKNGEVVELKDGTTIDGRDLVGAPRPGRKLAYCTDTIFSQNSVELARGADLLIHEATFCNDEAELAHRAGHSTAAQAAKVAKLAGVHTLIITHFSSRYDNHDGENMLQLLNEAQDIFPNTLAAHDFWSYDIPHSAAD